MWKEEGNINLKATHRNFGNYDLIYSCKNCSYIGNPNDL